MSAHLQKAIVIKPDRAIIRSEQGQVDRERDYWVQFRQGLLIQLSALEKKLGLVRRCKHCGGQLD